MAHLTAAMVRHSLPLLAWVIMPEHLHLILSPTAEESVSSFLNAVKNPLAKEVLGRWRAMNAAVLPRLRDRDGDVHFWQAGGGYDRHVTGAELLEKVRYVHANPVARGLSPDSVSWTWSSAAAFRGRSRPGDPNIAFELVPASATDLT